MRTVEAEFVKSASDLTGAPPAALPEVAFLGRSNVGKSSMINALLGRRKLARVSNTPGRTQLLNFFKVRVRLEDTRWRELSVCDLPGYGYAKVPKDELARWKLMIERYLGQRDSLRAAIALIDARHGPSPQDHALLDWLTGLGRPVVTVVTKMDKLPKSQRRPALKQIAAELGREQVLGFSSESGEGREELWEAIVQLTGR